MSQQRNIEMRKIFCKLLGPIPCALTDSMGTMMKTSKAILMYGLEKLQSRVRKYYQILVS